jgi:hypothetical protein
LPRSICFQGGEQMLRSKQPSLSMTVDLRPF